MKILLHEDVWLAYLGASPAPAGFLKYFRNILENEQNEYVYSKPYFEKIQNDLENLIDDLEVFETIRKTLIDNGTNARPENLPADADIAQIITEMGHTLPKKETYVALAITPKPALKNALLWLKIACFEQYKKPNLDWIVWELVASARPLDTFRPSHFTNTAEVKTLFETFFELIPTESALVHIFSRMANSPADTKLSTFKNKHKIHYYTLKHGDFDAAKIRKNFKSCLVFATHDKTKLHARRIIFEGFVLDMDNDLENMNLQEDWQLTFQYCPTDAQKLIDSTADNFKKYI
jgi:hypothetical protein